MLKSIKAIVFKDGRVLLKEPLNLKVSHKAIVTILDEKAELGEANTDALRSERALTEERIKPEEAATEPEIELASATDIADDFLSEEEINYYLQLEEKI